MQHRSLYTHEREMKNGTRLRDEHGSGVLDSARSTAQARRTEALGVPAARLKRPALLQLPLTDRTSHGLERTSCILMLLLGLILLGEDRSRGCASWSLAR